MPFTLLTASLTSHLSSQEKNLEWFPRMRAMSLLSSEGDNEQNEMRSLQDKLDGTVTLVAQLSGQLSELKDQVLLATSGHVSCGCEKGSGLSTVVVRTECPMTKLKQQQKNIALCLNACSSANCITWIVSFTCSLTLKLLSPKYTKRSHGNGGISSRSLLSSII